jgi:ABC-type multidrug transport system fused ATPase/permease subunit
MKNNKINTSRHNAIFRSILWLRIFSKYKVIAWSSVFFVTVFNLIAIILEALSFSIFIPIIEYIKSKSTAGEFVPESKLSQLINDLFIYFNIEVTLIGLSALLVLLVCFRQFFIFLNVMFIAKVRWETFSLFSQKIFSKFLNAKIEVGDTINLGKFSSLLHDDIKINSSLLTIILMYTQVFFMFLAYSIILLYNSFIAAIAAILIIVSATIIYYPIIKKSKRKSSKNISLRYQYINSLNEYFRSIRETKVYLNYQAVSKIFKNFTNEYSKSYVAVAKLSAKLDLLFIPTILISLLIIINFLYNKADLSFESIILLVAALMRLVPIGRSFTKSLNQFAIIEPSLERTFDLINTLELNKENNSVSNTVALLPKNEIFFKNINFSYPGSAELVLNNFTAKIPVGKITAITGPSGSGKSTLIDILSRFRDVNSGHILFDDQDITKLPPDNIRNIIAYLPQVPFLFDNSIKENIKFGKINSNLEDLKNATKLAGASQFINNLSKQYETLAGELGGKFSGGQRQRIGLARALISNRKILILDEPSSALDENSERIIKETLVELSKNKNYTIIIIAHRESLISISDHIIEIKAGKSLINKK